MLKRVFWKHFPGDARHSSAASEPSPIFAKRVNYCQFLATVVDSWSPPAAVKGIQGARNSEKGASEDEKVLCGCANGIGNSERLLRNIIFFFLLVVTGLRPEDFGRFVFLNFSFPANDTLVQKVRISVGLTDKAANSQFFANFVKWISSKREAEKGTPVFVASFRK